MYQTYDEYDAHECEWLERRPVCCNCHEPIKDDYGYEVEPGTLWCYDCAMDWLNEQRKDIDELMEAGYE